MHDTDRLAASIETGIATSHQALHRVCRGVPRERGLSLHLAAFAAVCLGIRHAYQIEIDLNDLHLRIERALRHLGDAWDERPVVRRERSLFAAFLHLGALDPDRRQGSVHDSAALSITVPGIDAPEPGDRGAYLVSCYRRYVDGVYVYCCGRGANTWDESGRPFALERGLFDDLGLAPPPVEEEAGPGVFESLLHATPPTVGTGECLSRPASATACGWHRPSRLAPSSGLV